MMHNIDIAVETKYLGLRSRDEEKRYAFSYTITIANNSAEQVQLLSRHWIIKDSDIGEEEVHGPGVVGQTPLIMAGDSFTYSSGAILKSPVGTMHGSYHFIDADNQPFDVEIPMFRLAVASLLH